MAEAASLPVQPHPSPASAGWRLEHSYAQLPALFHVAVAPTPVRAPRLVVLNRSLAASLGLNAEALAGEDGAQIFSGNRLPPGAMRQPHVGAALGRLNRGDLVHLV